MEDRRNDPSQLPPHRPQPSGWLPVAMFGAAALGVIQFFHPPANLIGLRPGERLLSDSSLVAAPSPVAFGRSGQVKIRFALPDERVEYPLDVRGDTTNVGYEWVRLGDGAEAGPARPAGASSFISPLRPGFYHLALVRGAEHREIDGMTIAVLVPFSQKLGNTLNGYKIGKYLAEKIGSKERERPPGFVEVRENDLDLPLTKHLRVADFVTHDRQKTWPRYVALDPRLLDKLELVIAEIARWRGDSSQVEVELDVHSGFRTPLYNRTLRRSASDSRHQYGDAADVIVDANGDGKINQLDARLVALAVERVESEHPELIGGMGLYTRGKSPYVHIDARGKRARWRG